MKIILFALALSFAMTGVALAASTARYDFTNGQPGQVAIDGTRYDFVNGQPAIADEEAVAATGDASDVWEE